MPTCLISLGANLGDPARTFASVIEELVQCPAVGLLAQSNWRRTTSIGGPAGQSDFLNAALLLETELTPRNLLQLLQNLEQKHGRQRRQRRQRWGPRTLDLDLLLCGQQAFSSPELTIPHPRMTFRRFVLEPAAEIAGDMIHPNSGWTVSRLLAHLNRCHNYVAITGPPAVGKTWVAQQAAEQLRAEFLPADPQENCWQDSAPGPQAAVASAEIEVVERRSRMLAHSSWKNSPGIRISDFWLEESLVRGRLLLDASEMRTLENYWQTVGSRIVTPKLLVILPSNPESAPNPGDTSVNPARLAGWASELESELEQQIRRSNIGPRLWLDRESLSVGDSQSTTLQWAVEEVTAAALAMR